MNIVSRQLRITSPCLRANSCVSRCSRRLRRTAVWWGWPTRAPTCSATAALSPSPATTPKVTKQRCAQPQNHLSSSSTPMKRVVFFCWVFFFFLSLVICIWIMDVCEVRNKVYSSLFFHKIFSQNIFSQNIFTKYIFTKYFHKIFSQNIFTKYFHKIFSQNIFTKYFHKIMMYLRNYFAKIACRYVYVSFLPKW